MKMEWQSIIDIVGGGVLAVVGWFARELWAAVKGLQKDISKLREELPKTYVAKDDFSDFRRELMTVLTRIETKLDGKADK